MVFIVLAILGILVYISVMYFKHIELKYKQKQRTAVYDKTKVLEYVCPNCGRTIPSFNILNLGNDRCWYMCSSCGKSADIKLSKLQKFKNVIPLDDIIDKIPNSDSIKDWDLKSAKDVEFSKVKESFNRKSDLD